MLGTNCVYRQFDKGKAMGPGLGHGMAWPVVVYMSLSLTAAPFFFLSR